MLSLFSIPLIESAKTNEEVKNFFKIKNKKSKQKKQKKK
jgi:hypothetical protein